MRLTRKFIAVLVLGVALVALLEGWLDYERERAVFDQQLRSEASTLGRALARGLAYVWERDGEAAARAFLSSAASQRDDLRASWVWLDEQQAGAPNLAADDLALVRAGEAVTRLGPLRQNLYTYLPVDGPGDRPAAIEIRQSLARRDTYIRTSLRAEVLASAASALVAALMAVGLGIVFIGRPIGRLAAKARRVGLGDLSGPLHLTQRDELGELATEINLMCDRLADERRAREQALAQLRDADRLTTVGKLASGLAHELGTPLNVVSGRAKLIQRGEVEGADVADSARIVVEQADRMTALIRQLLDFARPKMPHKAPLNVTTVAARVCELVATIARTAGVTVTPPDPDEALRVAADDGQVTQVLTNLVVNAIHATPPGGRVAVRASVIDRAPPPHVEATGTRWMAIAVEDTGRGIDAAARARIFEPFFTTKDVGEGTGLGLSVSWGIVREHGGWIDVDSAPGEGATFTVYLPAGFPTGLPAGGAA